MKKILAFLLSVHLLMSCGSNESPSDFDFTTQFEKSEGTETATYEEVIAFYQNLADAYTSVAMYEMRSTDSGKPLHLVTFNPNRTFESEFSDDKRENILLINNGIHPGESDGIDASMMLLRDFAEEKIKAPQNTIIAVIPVYNIGGALNRNSGTRTNQNGPKEYGFRGNARNYDLNRDFIKADTKNARSFTHLFRALDPDLFIDNHVSNGADYQYTLTHLFTQHNKLGGPLGDYLHTSFTPQLEDSLAQKNWDITPYVNVWGTTPENGFTQFMDSPRYSTGYTTLYNTLGMMVETHMLKPYKDRVEGTYELMKSFIAIADNEAEVIKELRKNAMTRFKVGDEYPLAWKVDSSQTTTLSFKGYEGERVPSAVTGANRLKYDRTKPFEKDVTYYNYFEPSNSVTVPEKYIVPQGYWHVMDRLKENGIDYERLRADTSMNAQVYKIRSYESRKRPYEGHYQHYNTQVEMVSQEVQLRKGDYVVSTQQPGIRYLLETLEPTAPDSFFNWNYFDAILQQKEGFSPYVWEDKAEALLNENPEMKAEFEAKKASDENFANNWFAQLDWIHKQSHHYEKSHLRYPIVRVGG
ncbi:MAG: M14 family metallopeptidase [Flavobacteriaceae bacterium]|nr:M14 family metallopeptidase [Flavobacteriaceae bacterium]